MQKNTILQKIETSQNGSVQLCIYLTDVDGTKKIHRTSLAPATNIDGHLNAVNINISIMGYPILSNEDIDLIRTECIKSWTYEIISAYEVQKNNSFVR